MLACLTLDAYLVKVVNAGVFFGLIKSKPAVLRPDHVYHRSRRYFSAHYQPYASRAHAPESPYVAGVILHPGGALVQNILLEHSIMFLNLECPITVCFVADVKK